MVGNGVIGIVARDQGTERDFAGPEYAKGKIALPHPGLISAVVLILKRLLSLLLLFDRFGVINT